MTEERVIPPAVAEFAVEERQRLLDRIAELEAHCVRLGQGEAERYWENRWREVDAELAALKAQLQAAPAESGAISMPDRKDAWLEHGDGFHWANGFNECLDEVARLNPAPATSDSDVREVKS